ncbi:MAG: FtsX-like permease family protein [Campylobacterales bacterium]
MLNERRGIVGFIVRRYLRFDPSQPFISIAALLAFLGVGVGVMVLIVAMAIMNGFDREFREKLFVMNYPITVQPRFSETMDEAVLAALEARFPDFRFSPYLRAQAISRKGALMEGNIVFGVDFERERHVNKVVDRAIGDRVYAPFEALAGRGLYDHYALSESEKLLLVFTRTQPVGLSMTPVMKRFSVQGVFESGLIAYDKAYFYVRLEDLRAVLGLEAGRIHGIHIHSDNPMADIEAIKAFLGPQAAATGWWEQNSNFFSALELEKRALFLVLMLIILVASLNIVSSLLMTVLNRRKEIALLLSLGASRAEVQKIFFLLGAVIGMGGIVLGLGLGGLSLWALSSFDIVSLPADVYGTARLPLELSGLDLSFIVLGAFLIVLASAWYPARKASGVDALDTLRHE